MSERFAVFCGFPTQPGPTFMTLLKLRDIGANDLAPINAWASDRGVDHVPVPVDQG